MPACDQCSNLAPVHTTAHVAWQFLVICEVLFNLRNLYSLCRKPYSLPVQWFNCYQWCFKNKEKLRLTEMVGLSWEHWKCWMILDSIVCHFCRFELKKERELSQEWYMQSFSGVQTCYSISFLASYIHDCTTVQCPALICMYRPMFRNIGWGPFWNYSTLYVTVQLYAHAYHPVRCCQCWVIFVPCSIHVSWNTASQTSLAVGLA